MTTARNQQVSLDVTPYYHCVSRCVRRTFLCGYDSLSKRSFEHRRGWIEQRIKLLASLYCVNICAYAVMSNHYHLVVHIDKERAESLTDREVIERWSSLHCQPFIIQRYLECDLTSNAEFNAVKEIISTWRERLFNLSWFMRELNFEIALRANQEDGCTGHFWESRYKSQALLDDKALLAAMAYVDLNPVRSGIADTPEDSDYTSIKERLRSLCEGVATPTCLSPFIANTGNTSSKGIPFCLMDYIELVDWTGRSCLQGKACMSERLPPLLERLSLDQHEWRKAVGQLERKRALRIGSLESLRVATSKLEGSRIFGYRLN